MSPSKEITKRTDYNVYVASESQTVYSQLTSHDIPFCLVADQADLAASPLALRTHAGNPESYGR